VATIKQTKQAKGQTETKKKKKEKQGISLKYVGSACANWRSLANIR
jgi:hypothetical protein